MPNPPSAAENRPDEPAFVNSLHAYGVSRVEPNSRRQSRSVHCGQSNTCLREHRIPGTNTVIVA
jgi:hypothetical protein